jgi:hypothetical protein
MSSLAYANQKLYEAWLCLFGDRDEQASLSDRVNYALTTLAPGLGAVQEILESLSDDDRADLQTITDAWGNRETMDVHGVERAIARLDRAVLLAAAATKVVHAL